MVIVVMNANGARAFLYGSVLRVKVLDGDEHHHVMPRLEQVQIVQSHSVGKPTVLVTSCVVSAHVSLVAGCDCANDVALEPFAIHKSPVN
jgi:hypothetical protein